MLLVLDPAPEQVVERPQRVDVQTCQRVPPRPGPRRFWNRQRDGVDRLHQHALVVPVRPDQLQEAGLVSFVIKMSMQATATASLESSLVTTETSFSFRRIRAR